MKRILFSLMVLVTFFLSTNIQAQMPRQINYQGILLGTDEQPVPEGNYQLTFNLYDDAGILLWTEVHDTVYIGAGLFHVFLGSVNPLNLPFDKQYFLGIQVGNDPELQPRIVLLPVPYSIRADDANKVAGISVSTEPAPETLLPLDPNGKFPASVLPGGSPNGNFLKKGEPDTSRGNSTNPMLLVSNLGELSGDGINGRSTNGDGISGRSEKRNGTVGWTGANNGSGVLGFSTDGKGVLGRSDNNDGVVGWSGASNKSGVFGDSQLGTGVTGHSQADSGYGIAGMATGVNGRAVYGNATGSNGVGVFGRSDHSVGVEGRSASDSEWAPAIYGKNVGAGDGVYGWSQSRHGTFGVTYSMDTTHAGVYAVNNGAGPAVLADGDLEVKGDLVVSGAVRGDIGPKNGSPFPRPAYDSGWVSIARSEEKLLTHNIGGNVDNYVVDLQLHSNQYGFGINCASYGGDFYDTGSSVSYEGAWYKELTNESITVFRMALDRRAERIRVRIWVYN